MGVKCRNCKRLKLFWCPFKADSPDLDLERECEGFWQKTKADNIRSMSDEEMAKWLVDIGDYNCACCSYSQPCRFEHDPEIYNNPDKYDCYEGHIDWLRQPCDEK